MLDARPGVVPKAQPDNRKIQLRLLVRLAVIAAVGAFGLGYWAAHISAFELVAMARVLISVAAVTLVVSILSARTAHQLARIERHLGLRPLSRKEYWSVYADVLSDLGGLDGESSTDSGRLPPRP